jgi:hypothetical protein
MAAVTPNIVTSGSSFAQLQQSGVSGFLEAVIAANGAATTNPPTAPTLAASGSGGTFPAGTWFAEIVERNGIGTTLPSPASASVTVSAGEDLVVTPHTLQTGNTAYDVYLSDVSAEGPFLLAAAGQTASTTTFTAPPPTNSEAVAPPTVNTTAFTFTDANGNGHNDVLRIVRSLKNGNFPLEYKRAQWEVDTFLRGDPIPYTSMADNLARFRAAVAILSQALTDIATLLAANPGTLTPAISVTSQPATVRRTWP